MKKIVFIVLGLLGLHVLLEALLAADISSGHVFVPNEQDITHVEMNAIVGGATINTTFITDKSSLAPSATDVFLYYSVANTAFRKTTLNDMALQNTVLITAQTEDANPAYNDFVLTYDTSAGSLKKAALQNLIANGTTNLFARFSTIVSPTMQDLFPFSENSTNGVATGSNIFRVWGYSTPLSNMPPMSALTNGDLLLAFDSVNKSNRTISLAGMITNLPPVTSVGNAGDTIGLMSNGLVLVKTTLGALKTNNWLFPTPTNQPAAFYSDLIPAGGSQNFSFTGYTPGVPQVVRWTIICTNVAGNDGFVLNDELPIEQLQDAGNTNIFQITYNGIQGNIFQTSRPIRVWNSSGNRVSITNQAMWKLKFRAVYIP